MFIAISYKVICLPNEKMRVLGLGTQCGYLKGYRELEHTKNIKYF